ncbi:MAG: hypothetical protein IKQ92_06230 [Clostridia bacterium]|nr:hypothetical protein [Clostridia bacterium]
MKRVVITLLLVCAVIFAVENIMLIFLCVHYEKNEPFANIIESISKITYSSGSHDREKELKEKDIINIRDSLLKTNLYGPCLKRYFRGNKEALHIYIGKENIHTIVFEGTIDIFGFIVGVVEYDGEEYFCDEWLIHHYRYIVKEFKYT